MLENELDEKQRMGEMCQRLKDEVRGGLSVVDISWPSPSLSPVLL